MNLTSAVALRTTMLVAWCGCVRYTGKVTSEDIDDPNSDINLDSLQLIAKHGYTPQRHSVVTEDGYIVNLFRIPSEGPPVLMVHGIGDSSDSWLVTGPSSSLAYRLAALGYDVWLYNARGNKYSRGHVTRLPERQYWDFSYEQMGSMDLPASVEYVLSVTNRAQVDYVGFSQGTTLFFVMASLRPEYNVKIKRAIQLAPVAWLDRVKYPFMRFFAQNIALAKSVLDAIGVYDLFQNNEFLKRFHARVCRGGVPERIFCDLEYGLSYGVRNLTNLNINRLPAISAHIPAGLSTKTIVHFFQIYSSKRFQRFDNGVDKNMEAYASARPPELDVSAVSAPVHLLVSAADWFSTVRDVATLRARLPNVVTYHEFNKSLDFTHLEFVYGRRTATFVNDRVVNILLSDARL